MPEREKRLDFRPGHPCGQCENCYIPLVPDWQWPALIAPALEVRDQPSQNLEVLGVRRDWSRTNPHLHGTHELLIPLAGDVLYGINEGFVQAHPGRVIWFRPGVVHDAGYPPAIGDCDHLWVRLLARQCAVFRVVAFDGRAERDDRIRFLFDESELGVSWLQWFSDAPGPRQTYAVLALAAAVLRIVLSSRLEQAPIAGVAEVVGAVQAHLRSTAGRGDHLESLADMAGYSKFHFLRVFKQETGMTVQAFVNAARATRVAELLANGASVGAIAQELGFASASSFRRWWRTYRGLE